MEKDYIEKVLDRLADSMKHNALDIVRYRYCQYLSNPNESTRRCLVRNFSKFLMDESEPTDTTPSYNEICEMVMKTLGTLSEDEVLKIMDECITVYFDKTSFIDIEDVDDVQMLDLASSKFQHFIERYMKPYMKYLYDHEHHLVRVIVMKMTDKYDKHYIKNETNTYNRIQLHLKLGQYDKIEEIDSDRARYALLKANPEKYVPIYTEEKREGIFFEHIIEALTKEESLKYYRNSPLDKIRAFIEKIDTDSVFDKDGKFIPENNDRLSPASKHEVLNKMFDFLIRELENNK